MSVRGKHYSKSGPSHPCECSEANSNYLESVEERTLVVYEYVHPEWTKAIWMDTVPNETAYSISAWVVNQLDQNGCASVVFVCLYFLRIIYSDTVRS